MFRSILLATLVSAAVPLGAIAQPADDLKNDEKTPGDVLTYGMGYSQQRFSPLSQINRDNVKRLVPAWFYSMANNLGQEAQPLVKAHPVRAEYAHRLTAQQHRRGPLGQVVHAGWPSGRGQPDSDRPAVGHRRVEFPECLVHRRIGHGSVSYLVEGHTKDAGEHHLAITRLRAWAATV